MPTRPGQKRKWAEQRQDISQKNLLEPKPKGLFHRDLPTRVDKILELSKPPCIFISYSVCVSAQKTPLVSFVKGGGGKGEEKAP